MTGRLKSHLRRAFETLVGASAPAGVLMLGTQLLGTLLLVSPAVAESSRPVAVSSNEEAMAVASSAVSSSAVSSSAVSSSDVTSSDSAPSSEALVDLIERLAGDRPLRDAARRQLMAHGKVAVPYLMARAKDARFSMRWEVVNLLGSLKSPEAIDTLIERVAEDSDPHVRWRSMWALKRIPEPTVADRLAKVCAEEGSRGWNACVGLSLFADVRALPRLQQNLSNPDSWVRWEAIDALGRVHDEHTASLLERCFVDPNERVRQEVVLSLAEIGDETAVAALIRALDDASAGVRWRAAMGLGRRALPQHLDTLEGKLVSENDTDTRKYLAKAIERLDQRRSH